MKSFEDIRLDEYNDDDIFDIVVKLEKSFGIKFNDDSFINVKTFGDICDVIVSYIKSENKGDCTKQQAFYKIRTAITEMRQMDKRSINVHTRLIDLFPRYRRRGQVKTFQRKLGINLKFLTYPKWVAFILMIEVLGSFIMFFINWKIAVCGFLFFVVAVYIADKLGKDLEFETVKELAERATSEHYIHMRRSKLTVNKDEIVAIIKKAFITHEFDD
jgi:hypothetical protein